ncbi:hypothetical protein HOP50_01g05380 [Chloropicon primus]|uniref:Enhancer of mRNA-decapping protein 4 C-terminal domain-containing protein n=1 Tax=Chloropicon primus TaxID=1764295 RepID=A0A5B8MFB0_9CHLO|nr:hypothetical protein A3770_01p05500 [Chloropicon primus]UPQ97247.1 hypothetical protein HOP50_01g05380 [Chloropicon primus]|eukprot:QDZ18032.1 hypothetical protein A3770_01p05500 [Chloropicon primus]
MANAEEAGAALLAALTGLSPPSAVTPESEGEKRSAQSFSIGGASALKAAASKGFKFRRDDQEEEEGGEQTGSKEESHLMTPTEIQRSPSPMKLTQAEVEKKMLTPEEIVKITNAEVDKLLMKESKKNKKAKGEQASDQAQAQAKPDTAEAPPAAQQGSEKRGRNAGENGVNEGEIRKAVISTVKKVMGDTIVPAFEQSCREMFRQMNSALKSGMQKHASQVSQPLKGQLQSLEESVKSMEASMKSVEAAIKSLEATVKRQEGSIKNLAARQSAAGQGDVKAPRLLKREADPKALVKADLEQRKFEEAFSRALMSQDVDLVLWLCEQIGEEEFFYQDPFPLSQSVLLALLQQVGSDLKKGRETKFSWIQRILLKLDTDYFEKEGLLQHLPPVLKELQGNLGNLNVKAKEKSRLEVVHAILTSVTFTVNAKLGI